MAALVVVQRVLRAVEIDIEEGGTITADPQCHRLPPHRAAGGWRCGILHSRQMSQGLKPKEETDLFMLPHLYTSHHHQKVLHLPIL